MELLVLCVGLVAVRTLTGRRRVPRPAATPVPVPVVHQGAEDDAATGEWLLDIATAPVDPWDAMLREFQSTLDVEQSGHDERFWSAIGPEWTELVREDVAVRAEFRRQVRAVLESADEYTLVGVR